VPAPACAPGHAPLAASPPQGQLAARDGGRAAPAQAHSAHSAGWGGCWGAGAGAALLLLGLRAADSACSCALEPATRSASRVSLNLSRRFSALRDDSCPISLVACASRRLAWGLGGGAAGGGASEWGRRDRGRRTCLGQGRGR
jgi:hypothetical protein